jgi:hypothetical protein
MTTSATHSPSNHSSATSAPPANLHAPSIRHGYSYEAALHDSLKVNWRVEDVIGEGDFDFTRPFLPDALAGISATPHLDAADRLTLNHIRGRTYLYLFGFVEEFILPFVVEASREAVHGDSPRVRALLGFAQEEAKHIDLFRRFSEAYDRKFATPIDLIGPAEDVARAVLAHGKLGVLLTILHLEWLTLKHYLDAVKDTGEPLDPHFVKLLKFHWQEESQHAKLDTLLTAEHVAKLNAQEIQAGFDDYLKIAGLLDGGLVAQVSFDLAALEKHRGRSFDPEQRADIIAAQVRSYRHTFLVAGAQHPTFVDLLGQISPAGQRQVAAVAAELAAHPAAPTTSA